MSIEAFQEINREPLAPADIKALGQPERYVFGLYKFYRFFIGCIAAMAERCERLEAPTQDLVNRLVDERVAQVCAELEKKWADRIRLARFHRELRQVPKG
jgi:hypothetical protein